MNPTLRSFLETEITCAWEHIQGRWASTNGPLRGAKRAEIRLALLHHAYMRRLGLDRVPSRRGYIW